MLLKVLGQFVKAHFLVAVTIYLAAGVLFVTLLIAYAAAESYGGTRLGGWRVIALGQAYILGRLTLRLTPGASDVRLAQRLGVDQLLVR
ncbi:MAG: hypothetical protein WD690_00400 [Vicinamibacterales bacterium]